MSIISRGEIWLVNFDPQIGAEIQKKRPAIVIDTDIVAQTNTLPLRVVVPLTTASNRYKGIFWMIPILKSGLNGLKSDSFADTSQIKSISEQRFESKIGLIEPAILNEIVIAVTLYIGYKP